MIKEQLGSALSPTNIRNKTMELAVTDSALQGTNTGDAVRAAMDMTRDLGEENIIKRPIKKSNIKKLVGKTKMKLPIGKIFTMSKISENKLFDISKKEMDELINEKWSQKYKDSIDCKNPKGFSQRAHCQGKKKKLQESLNEAVRSEMAQLKDLARKFAKNEKEGKTEKEKIEKMLSTLQKQFRKGMKVEMEHKMGVIKAKQIALDHLKENPLYYDDLEKVENPKKIETKEATSTSSSGQYSGPAFGAKSMSPKHWRGRAKTQIPGGDFVQVKKKCKTFPYCNQGDINALEISRNPVVKKKKKKLAEQYGVSEELIMQIILNELYKNLEK
jgi:hypothetical protein